MTYKNQGDRVVCLVDGCDAQRRLILRVEEFDRERQLLAIGRTTLSDEPLPVYHLECGHSVTYFTGP